LPADNGPPDSPNSAQVGVQEFFNDPLLTSLIYQALGNNLELKILNEDIQIAGNVILGRTGAYLPSVGPQAFAAWNKASSYTLEGAGIRDDPFAPGQYLPNPYGNFFWGASISWQIDIWKQLRNARDAAVQKFFATGEGRNYLVTRMVAEIAENYFRLMALDKRMENLNYIIELQEQSLKFAEKMKIGARGTELPVARFRAEVRKNQSERLIVTQDIIIAENRINFLLGRYPQPVERSKGDFINLNLHALSLGVPSQLLLFRPDIRQAERELESNGLDVLVARKRFLPVVTFAGPVGYETFNPRYIVVTPEAIMANLVGGMIVPLVNRRAIKADYLTANARQLQALYDYQRTILNAYTEVVNRVSMVENYRRSIEIKKQQVASLEESVVAATRLFQNARAEYIDVLFAQRDLLDARRVLIDTKQEQLSALVNAYQALGGGNLMPMFSWAPPPKFNVKHFWHWHAWPGGAVETAPKPYVPVDPMAPLGGQPGAAAEVPGPPGSPGPWQQPAGASATPPAAMPALPPAALPAPAGASAGPPAASAGTPAAPAEMPAVPPAAVPAPAGSPTGPPTASPGLPAAPAELPAVPAPGPAAALPPPTAPGGADAGKR
jgi:outer membrane protein TolC